MVTMTSTRGFATLYSQKNGFPAPYVQDKVLTTQLMVI